MSQLNSSANYSAALSAARSASLPAYKVRESSRAKRVSIKISVEGEVEVVVPPRFKRSKLPEILKKRQGWIEKTRARLLSDRVHTSEDWQVEKPDTILLRWRSNEIDDNHQNAYQQDDAIETWSVGYDLMPGDKTICIPGPPHHITLKGNTDYLPACQAVLRNWLAYQAKRELAPWLRQLGLDLGLPCRNVSVRGQKTCWASCSVRKDISLNFKLLFLPRPLVHYVLVHELCHTVHMNHSKDFWALVGQKQPDYLWRRKAIKNAWRYVPRWVETK